MYDANLQNAILWKADFESATMRKANLQGAILHGANLSNVNLERAELFGSKLEGATCNNATIWPEGFDYKAAGVINVDEEKGGE